MARKRAKQTQGSVFVWHMEDSDEDSPATLCGIGTHAGAKRGWRYGSEGLTANMDWVTCQVCKRILADREAA